MSTLRLSRLRARLPRIFILYLSGEDGGAPDVNRGRTDDTAAGAPIPTLVQILNGEKPPNTHAVRLEAPPGSRWKYSGGGYTVMQQLLIDVSYQQFSNLLQDTVLAPIGMTRSTHEQPLPVELRSGAAMPYNSNGTPVEGGFHTYPEMAAAGLWTTPTDLARYAIEIQRSRRGDANHVLSAEMTRQMLVAGQGSFGLGLEIGGSPKNPYFTHGGINVRATIKVDPAILSTYTGVYELTPTFSITITLENGQLIEQTTNQPKFPLFPESQSKFFLKVVDAEIEFFEEAGQISHLALHQNGHETRGKRKQ